MTDTLGHGRDAWLSAVEQGTKIYDLGRPMFPGIPQVPSHPQFRMALVHRHGDQVWADGLSSASEMIVTGSHVGTHMDAPAHVSYKGALHGGVDAAEAQRGGTFSQLGVDTIFPIVARGVLLDVPASLGMESCPPAYEVTPADLEAAAAGRVRAGDVILVRTGWARRFGDPEAYLGHESGVPGPGETGAKWLAAHKPRAVGADTIGFEHVPPGPGHSLLPGHRVLLVEAGIPIIEVLDLEALASDAVAEFVFVLSPLHLVGATGSPVRPLAVVEARSGWARRSP